ncbi:MAG: hypothetical protein CSB34_05085 [Desulfobulbus propionicus]|nr:MAG: hypothetical protein CSB34_05085 [Desulfobulbus propionicus]
MKRLVLALVLTAVACLSVTAFAADKEVLKSHVDEVVAAIDGGKDASAFTADAYVPYVFIMQADGLMIVHPSLAGQDLKAQAMPIYEALQGATPEGMWIQYEWKGKEKNTYARTTKSNLLVASGY